MNRHLFIALLAICVVLVNVRAQAQVIQPTPVILGKFRTIITASGSGCSQTALTCGSTPGTCYSAEVGPGFFIGLINTGPAMTAYPQFYDEGGAPTCSAADLIYGDGTSATAIQSGQIILLSIPTRLGIAYEFPNGGSSLPSTQNLIISRI